MHTTPHHKKKRRTKSEFPFSMPRTNNTIRLKSSVVLLRIFLLRASESRISQRKWESAKEKQFLVCVSEFAAKRLGKTTKKTTSMTDEDAATNMLNEKMLIYRCALCCVYAANLRMVRQMLAYLTLFWFGRSLHFDSFAGIVVLQRNIFAVRVICVLAIVFLSADFPFRC